MTTTTDRSSLAALDAAETAAAPLSRQRAATRERLAPTFARIAAQRAELEALHGQYGPALAKVRDTLTHRYFVRTLQQAGPAAERVLAQVEPKARDLANWCPGWIRALDEAVTEATRMLNTATSEVGLRLAEARLPAAIVAVQPAEVPRMLRELAGGVEALLQYRATFADALGPDDAVVALADLQDYAAMFSQPDPEPPAKAARPRRAA